jgi:argininosuccinate synthase
MKEKVILAYSGGLDTTAIIPWLKENYDYDVVCCCIDVGQGNELDGLEERAKYSGAEKLYILDVVDEFVDEYCRSPIEHKNDFEYPVNRWRASDGVNYIKFEKVFGYKF